MKPRLAQILKDRTGDIRKLQMVTGFDGFVDEMITLVGKREGLDDYKRVETIEDFGAQILAAKGHSSLREIVVSRTDAGGCAVNMGDALAELGVQVDTYATLGEPPHPAFQDYIAKARTVQSWGRQPGRTLAFEFADGKCMFSSVSQLAELTPAYVEERLKDGRFKESCAEADLIAFTDWTLYPHMTACWRLIGERVLSRLPARKPLFVDLVDPSSRSAKDISEMLEVLGALNHYCRVTPGLNVNEANIVAGLMGCGGLGASTPTAGADMAAGLREKLGVSEVVIHGRSFAALANCEETEGIEVETVVNPVKSTGAGDRFNAGYAVGVCLGLPAADRLGLACATARAYVRLGRSPSLGEVGEGAAAPRSDGMVEEE